MRNFFSVVLGQKIWTELEIHNIKSKDNLPELSNFTLLQNLLPTAKVVVKTEVELTH